MFDFELDRVSSWINSNSFRKVAIQLPEGLKSDSFSISEFLKSKGVECVILGNPCYGACDLCTDFEKYADALIHFGHSEIPCQKTGKNVLYVESFFDGDITEHISKIAGELPEKIGLLATVQYVKCLEPAKKVLENKGKKVLLKKGDDRIKYPGQVLGCNSSSAEGMDVDCYLFVGEGNFHPLAVAFGTDKDVKVLNPVTGELRSVNEERDKILRKRFAAIESSKNLDVFGIIVSEKIGQNREKLAFELSEKIRKAGKKSLIIRITEITPLSLMPYKVDCFVSTACPRVAMDDSAKYGKPMLTATELDIVLGFREWKDYTFDAIRP